ncbi:MAG: hypothetical protein ACI9SQ_000197 [Rubritalea sp.]|jgi:hypothetical protein
MPVGGYATFAGPATKAFAEATTAQVKKQFGIEMAPSQIPESPGGIAAYGVLVRELNFEKAFYRSKSSLLEFKDRANKMYSVQFFGTKGHHSAHYRESVDVLRYENKGIEFIISMASKTKGERVIIYKSPKAGSFRYGINQVLASQEKPLSGKYGSLEDPQLHERDTVKIPYLSLQSKADFLDQLQGLRFFLGEPRPWIMRAAYQLTQFELTEKGAKVRVQTGVADDPFGGPPEKPTIVPRHFICDGAFYVFLWKDDAKLPYFAALIDSADVLKQFVKE